MKTWHTRLDEAIAARGKTWLELFEYLHREIQITKPSVYAWKPNSSKRTTMIDGENAALVCHWLDISPLWLFYGKGESGLEGDNTVRDIKTMYSNLTYSRKTIINEVLHSLVATQDAEEDAAQIRQQAQSLFQTSR